VKAARAAVEVAEQVRAAECEKRGPKCRDRETDEQAKRDSLIAVLANKAATDKILKLEVAAAVVRERLANAPPVLSANPLGAVLEQLVGATASILTAWQQAIAAGVFELCLVGVMVIFELLGHANGGESAVGHQTRRRWHLGQALHRQTQSLRSSAWGRGPVNARLSASRPEAPPHATVNAQALAQHKHGLPEVTHAMFPVAHAGAPRSQARTVGSVRSFVLERLRPAEGAHLEMKVLLQAYRAWCEASSLEAKSLSDFAVDMRTICARAGLTIEATTSHVLCRDVRLVS
jgi:hypothetical protein